MSFVILNAVKNLWFYSPQILLRQMANQDDNFNLCIISIAHFIPMW